MAVFARPSAAISSARALTTSRCGADETGHDSRTSRAGHQQRNGWSHASGYVVKDIKGMELAPAIKAVGAGRSLLDNPSRRGADGEVARRGRAIRSAIWAQ